MNKKFLADIQIIKNAINTNKLVIFGGAGISIDANVPSWSAVISKIKDELDLPVDEKDFLKIAQIYFNDRQEKEYVEKIRLLLGHKKLRYNEIHEELFELNPEHILTTNFDDLLEQVITKNSLPFSIIKEDKDLPYSNNTKLLVKIHGDLELGNLVFKEDDYLGYQQNHPLLDSFIKAIFSTKVVLFVGYSFNDYNLKQIVQYVRNILGKNFQNAYLLSVDKNIHLSHRQYLKNKGINVINYFDADYSEKKGKAKIISNYIDDFLIDNNIYGQNSKYLKKVNSLSEKGQLLLNFLRFIRFYDNLKVPINEMNVVDQIYNSLIRFEELKVLPQDFISGLYPFKTTPEYENLIDYNSLLLKNEYLIELFFNKISIKGSEIILTHMEDADNKKIEFILRKLNNSLIFFVTKENEANKVSEGSKKIHFESTKICDCSKCKYERYQLRDSLIETNGYTITDTTDISEDMQKAFLNYKFGNYYQSFKMFEEIASKAWETQKFIIYYISKINMKALKGFVNWEFQINKEEKDLIIEKINNIDTDKLIFHIPNRSNEEYNLIKIIRDDKVLINVKYKVEDYYDKILENYKLFKKKYSNSIGPYYPQLIYLEIYKLIIFYNNNYIIKDEISEFKDIINKAIEALMVSYSTDNRYGGKIREFDIDFFELTVPYIQTTKFVKVLEDYKIKDIKFKKDNLEKVLNYSNNFFNSFFERNSFFNSELESEIIEGQLLKNLFEEKIKKIFNNIMVFLSLVELTNKQFEVVKSNLISFLSFERKLYGDSIKYLKWFLGRNYKSLSAEDCKKLLSICLEKWDKYERHQFIKMIGEICVENKYELIDNIEYAGKILSDIEYFDKNTNDIVYLWLIANEKIKKYYSKIIIEKLQKDFNVELYKSASLYKIIDYNNFFNNYIAYLNNLNKGNNTSKDGYLIENDKPKFHNFQFHNELLFLYKIGISGNDNRLKKLKKLHEFMKFCIYRENYNMSKFKVEWLHLFDYKKFFYEFRKVKSLKKLIESALKENFDEELALIYTKYFL